MERMKFREWRGSDLAGVIRLFADTFNRPPWNDCWTIPQATIYLSEIEGNPVFRGFIAEADGTIVASVMGHLRSWYSAREFHIDEMFVSPDFQRQKIGESLLRFAEKELKAEKVSRITLLTERSSGAESFYSSQGFKAVEKMGLYSKRLN